jgi:hypothetical protein
MRLLLASLLLISITLFGQGSSRNLVMVDEYQGENVQLTPVAAYPTYDHYLRLLNDLAERYPEQCQVETWGVLPSGRKIMALRIAAGEASANRPQVLCTAAMHGDETAGYWLMLRLAEHLLEKNPGKILDELTIYINPLANPDGAYTSDDSTLSGARRGNANGVDLNRNYPDPDDGDHPDKRDHQPETKIFQHIARDYGFDLAINLHGGAEVFNYPWDTYRNRHADTEWWRRISRDFASRAQAASGTKKYFQDRHNGVTNGHDWYPIAGSRQDYMNYYHRCREATLEVSNVKRFPAHQLSELWTFVHPALIAYIAEARYGFHGTVVDENTGIPLRANVVIPGHDADNSDIFSDGPAGDFYRFLTEGEYQVSFSAPGYKIQWQTVSVLRGEKTTVAVKMERLGDARK